MKEHSFLARHALATRCLDIHCQLGEFVDPFVFHAPTKISFGPGTAKSAIEVIKELGGSRVVLITDPQLLKMPSTQELIASWQQEGEMFIFGQVMPDATLEGVKKAAELAAQEKCDAVVALGGGSVIDTAKVVNILLTLGGDVFDHEGMNNLTRRLLPSVAIPTTAGTGAEVSPVAMVKDEQAGKKLVFGGYFMAMDHALLDPKLIISLPPRLTAATGMDAVTHCIESLVVDGTSSPLTDALALDALRRLFTYVPESFKDGNNIEARSQTLVASTMAGISFSSSGVGIVHALAHAIGGQFSTHHGMTNAVLLPYGMRFNLSFASARYGDMARHLKLTSVKNNEIAANTLIEAVEKLIETLGLPKNLKSLSVPELDSEKLDQLVELVIGDPAMIFNTRQADAQDIIEIYRKAY